MLKIAILGAGAISDSHIRSYLAFPDRCRIVAVADLYSDKAAEKVALHGLSAAVYANHQALLAAQDFDAASICLPPFAHASVAVDLLRAGRHVLVEKPMATCLQECDAMLAAAAETGRLLAVVSQNRFKIFQWLMGMPVEVRAIAANLAHDNSEVEDFSTAVLRYADGRLGQITASLVHHGEEQQFLVQGERAAVAVPWRVTATRQKENGFPEEDAALQAELLAFYDALPAVRYEGHDGQIDNFLNAIDGREPLLVDGDQGRRTLELITAIYLAAHLGQPVTLPLPATALFYTREGVLGNARHFHEKTRSVENFTDNGITLGRNVGR